jgi:hypothetical protein
MKLFKLSVTSSMTGLTTHKPDYVFFSYLEIFLELEAETVTLDMRPPGHICLTSLFRARISILHSPQLFGNLKGLHRDSSKD